MRAVVLNLTAESTDPGHGTDLSSVKKEAARRSSRKRLSIPRHRPGTSRTAPARSALAAEPFAHGIASHSTPEW
jgi:hypothetical protein